MKYREEIDGFRALAVLPVILYHAGTDAFRGGYIGVDIFFVISGFLITTLIVEGLHDNSFSIRKFYKRRARRLLAVLFFVMIVFAPAAYYLMLPDDLENFGQSMVATIAFGNNILLYLTSGYWGLQAEFKPLIHTWSLGVEEQYYIVAPLLILLVAKSGKRAIFWSFLAIFLVSLALSQVASVSAPDFGFFSITTRSWEIAVGAMVALTIDHERIRRLQKYDNLLGSLGLFLLLVSLVIFDETTQHPGLITLIPVLGTALIIIFANSTNVLGRVLSAPALVLLGLISYSAYLWHKPLFAFARLTALEEPGPGVMLPLALLSLVLAYFSWKFVEQPFRNPARIPTRIFLPVIISAGVGLGGLGLYWHSTSGMINNHPELAYDNNYGSNLNATYNTSVSRFEADAFPQDSGNPNILVIGDSFARDFINAGLENAYFGGRNVVYLPFSKFSYDISAASADQLKLLLDSDMVVYALSPKHDCLSCIARNIEDIAELVERRLVVVGTKNFGWNNNAVMLLPEEQRYTYRATVLDDVVKLNEDAKAVLPGSIFVDVIGMLADSDGRVSVFTPDKKLISQDRMHLTKYGAKYLGGILFQHQLLKHLR